MWETDLSVSFNLHLNVKSHMWPSGYHVGQHISRHIRSPVTSQFSDHFRASKYHSCRISWCLDFLINILPRLITLIYTVCYQLKLSLKDGTFWYVYAIQNYVKKNKNLCMDGKFQIQANNHFWRIRTMRSRKNNSTER